MYGLYFYIIRRTVCINEHDLVLQRINRNYYDYSEQSIFDYDDAFEIIRKYKIYIY